jgi:Leucine-rich repeat (LRR) protein
MQQKSFPDVHLGLKIPIEYLVKKLLFLFASIIALSVHAQDKERVYDDSTYIYRKLDEALKNPDRVFRLNLSRTKLDSFPSQIFSFRNLTVLDLSRNKIEEVPAEIGNLVHLRRLNLANNQLVHIPREIGKLKELEFLGLNRNILEDLPPEIGDLENLQILELWDNELDNIPDEISQLQNLKVLELRGILFTPEEQSRIDSLVVKSAKIYMSPSCNCKN